MKIVSHNINGLKAYVNSGRYQRILLEDADVYCFQEVKVSSVEKAMALLTDETLYKYMVSYVMNPFKKGYAGVMMMVKKDTAAKILDHIERPEETTVLLEGLSNYSCGRVVSLDFGKFYIINVYVVNSGSGKDMERQLFDNRLQMFLQTLDKPYVICGDFNVCATELDYYGNYKKAIDSYPGLMTFEIEAFRNLLWECKLHDVWREQHPFARRYTWCSPRVKNPLKGWRLDYFLCTDGIDVKSCDIKQGWSHFDHSPIILEINE